MYTCNTMGTGCSMPQCAKIHYHTCTCVTHFGNTAGLPAPVLNPMYGPKQEYTYTTNCLNIIRPQVNSSVTWRTAYTNTWGGKQTNGRQFAITAVVSVATVVTNSFRKRLNYDAKKLAKTVRIFVEIDHIKNRGVIFYPKTIGQLFPMLWSSHEFGHKFGQISWPLHSVGSNHLILSGQNMTPRFLMCSIFTNILAVLANFVGS